MNPYTIHFVCRGNIYRSRLAEAYLRSLGSDKLSVSSSGVAAHENPGIILAPYAEQAAAKADISEYVAIDKHPTTAELLAGADIIVCMNRDVFDTADVNFVLNPEKCVIWDVADIGERMEAKGSSQTDLAAVQAIAQETFVYIQSLVDQLVADVTHIGWADVVDDNNRSLGYRLPITWMGQRGLWRRGCHAIVTTADKRYIVEKRSKTIVFSPNKLDIGFGGGVDDGESPETAVIRELQEELGLTVAADDISHIDTYKWHSYHPRYKKFSNCFLYTYHIELPDAEPQMSLQKSEVAAAYLMTQLQIDRLLFKKRLTGYGSLQSGAAYLERMVKLVRQRML